MQDEEDHSQGCRISETLCSLVLEYVNLPSLHQKEPELLDSILQMITYEVDLYVICELVDMMGDLLCDSREDLTVKSKLIDLLDLYLLNKVGIPLVHAFKSERFLHFLETCSEADSLPLYFATQKLIVDALQLISLTFNNTNIAAIFPELMSKESVDPREPKSSDAFELAYCKLCYYILNPRSPELQVGHEFMQNISLSIAKEIQVRYRQDFLLGMVRRLRAEITDSSCKDNAGKGSITLDKLQGDYQLRMNDIVPIRSTDFDYLEVHSNQYKLTPPQLDILGKCICGMLNNQQGGVVLVGVMNGVLQGIEANKRQREILLEDIRSTCKRIAPSFASERILLKFMALKQVENSEKTPVDRCILKMSVERDDLQDGEAHIYRLRPANADGIWDWNFSEVHLRCRSESEQLDLNAREVATLAAIEDYYRFDIQPRESSIILQNSHPATAATTSNKETRLTFQHRICKLTFRAMFPLEEKSRLRVLWHYPSEDIDNEHELVLADDSSDEYQSEQSLKLPRGQTICYKLERYSEAERLQEKNSREYELQLNGAVLEIATWEGPVSEKFEEEEEEEEEHKKASDYSKEDKEHDPYSTENLSALQLTSRQSSSNQSNLSYQQSKDPSVGAWGEGLGKRKSTGPNTDARRTVLLEGIEALGKPPVLKQDLFKLFKPFNVDFNDIIVKNSKDCAFVEVKPDKWLEFKKTYENLGLLVSKRETKDDTLSWNQNLKNTYIGGFEKYVILKHLKLHNIPVHVDDVKTNFNGNVCRIFVQIRPEDDSKMSKLSKELGLKATVWKKRNAWIGGFNLLIGLANSAHVTDEDVQKNKMREAFLECLGHFLMYGEIEANDIKRDQYGYYYAFLDVKQEEWKSFEEKAIEKGLRVNNQIDR